MARKTKRSTEMIVDEPIDESLPVVEVGPEKPQSEKCGHINKQFMSTKGLLEDLPCTLRAGHSDVHKAEYQALREFSGMKNPNQTYTVWMGKEYELVTEVAEWSDAAGRPAAEYAQELAEKRAVLESFVKANPDMADAHKQKARELGLIPTLRA